ncbi:uncharacterized protein LOC113350746 [Papaver somniferum]|uniref:uncharacterized protein LOC113350746 n=1 Tax=Papaver somniferum TaxID=3469 RepID=UPI000E6F582F|nr:uncharacterized protein LOC113350746 [Papaver somniferum]
MDASSQAHGTATPTPASDATPTTTTETVIGSSIQPTDGATEPAAIDVEATSTQIGGKNKILLTFRIISLGRMLKKLNHWKLEKRIIMYCEVSGHKGIDIGEMLEKCLSDWGLKDVFSVTLDNVSANKVAIDYLTTSIVSMTWAEERAKYLHVRYAAHVIALVVKDDVRVYNKSIARIRRNNTFLMLEAALVFERAFTRLESEEEQEGEDDVKGKKKAQKKKNAIVKKPAPCQEDWIFARDLVKCLKVFFDATVAFSALTKVTTHTFLWQLVLIYEQLVEFRDNVDEDPFIATMAAKIEKEKGLEFDLECLYGKKSPKVELVMRGVLLDFKILFEEYKDVYSFHEEESSTSMQGQDKLVVSKSGAGPSRMKELMSRSKRFKSNPDDDVGKTELDKYLIDKFEEGEGEDELLGPIKNNATTCGAVE